MSNNRDFDKMVGRQLKPAAKAPVKGMKLVNTNKMGKRSNTSVSVTGLLQSTTSHNIMAGFLTRGTEPITQSQSASLNEMNELGTVSQAQVQPSNEGDVEAVDVDVDVDVDLEMPVMLDGMEWADHESKIAEMADMAKDASAMESEVRVGADENLGHSQPTWAERVNQNTAQLCKKVPQQVQDLDVSGQ